MGQGHVRKGREEESNGTFNLRLFGAQQAHSHVHVELSASGPVLSAHRHCPRGAGVCMTPAVCPQFLAPAVEV